MTSTSTSPPTLGSSSSEATGAADPLLTDNKAAVLLRLELSTFRRHVATGIEPRPLKLGGTSRWPRSEILAVIEAAKAKRGPAGA